MLFCDLEARALNKEQISPGMLTIELQKQSQNHRTNNSDLSIRTYSGVTMTWESERIVGERVGRGHGQERAKPQKLNTYEPFWVPRRYEMCSFSVFCTMYMVVTH